MSELTFRPQRQPLVKPGQIEHHVGDLTVTAAADVTLVQLQQQLALHDQWLPIDGDPRLPVGELVQTNSTGPLRLGFGAWRDLLLGVQFTTASGRLITAGGRTMKNVAGYDLTKFMVGQHGLFGRLVTITARTWKRPSAALLARFSPDERLMGQLLPTPLRPQWAMLAEGSLWCGYLGDQRSIDYYQANVPSWRPLEIRRQTPQQDIDFRAARWLAPDWPGERFRASVPPARVVQLFSQLALPHSAADAAFGIIAGACQADQKQRLLEQTAAVGGRVFFQDAESLQRRFHEDSAEAALLRRLKSAFDA
ncbi:FAD-binding oxidoreductase [Fontivita pretiosa]|uniref:FAD-binding oxidoreductase n=1 Tax=Fontivita pretiosa TaxID=2989684 RepID=UPI003D174D9B